MSLAVVVRAIARHMPLVPGLWLSWLALRRGRSVPVHLWWIAAAFAVSWVANMAARHWVDPWLPSLTYPLLQAMLIALVFVDRPRPALDLLVALTVTAFAAALWNQHHPGPDLLLHSAAFGAVTVIAWRRPQLGLLRTSLLISFGAWLVCWWLYVAFAKVSTPIAWLTWGAFQSARLTGEILFCRAALRPGPSLHLSTRHS